MEGKWWAWEKMFRCWVPDSYSGQTMGSAVEFWNDQKPGRVQILVFRRLGKQMPKKGEATKIARGMAKKHIGTTDHLDILEERWGAFLTARTSTDFEKNHWILRVVVSPDRTILALYKRQDKDGEDIGFLSIVASVHPLSPV